MESNCICESNEKAKYVYSLLYPENVKSCKVPSKIGTPTTVFKRKRMIEFTTNALGNISVQWMCHPFSITASNVGYYYNAVGYNGTTITASSFFTYAADTTGIIPTGTPVRLVAASMKINYSFGNSQYSGVLYGGSYDTPKVTTIADDNMSLFSNIASLPNSKMVNASKGMKIVYVPTNLAYFNFFRVGDVLGNSGAGATLNNDVPTTQCMVFYGTELIPSSTCISISFTQIYEAVTTSDLFNPYARQIKWDVSEVVKNYILDFNKVVTDCENDISNENEYLKMIVPHKKCSNKNRNKKSKSFFYPEKMGNFRLPSIVGEKTHLFSQRVSINVTTSSFGAFSVLWYPQNYYTSGSATTSGLYINNSPAFTGVLGGSITQLTDLAFYTGGVQLFSEVRLVSASLEARYVGTNITNSGDFLCCVDVGIYPTSTPTTPFTTTLLANVIGCKTFKPFEGAKIIYTPYDYTSLVFNQTDNMAAVNGGRPPLCRTMNLVGYGLLQNSPCVRLTFNRVFEGIPSITGTDYFTIKSSNLTMDECQEKLCEIVSNDLTITKLIDDKKINKILF